MIEHYDRIENVKCFLILAVNSKIVKNVMLNKT